MIRIRTSAGGAIAWIATTGVIALVAYLSRSTDAGCDNGYVSAPGGMCAESNGLWVARIAGTACGLTFAFFAFGVIRSIISERQFRRKWARDPLAAHQEMLASDPDPIVREILTQQLMSEMPPRAKKPSQPVGGNYDAARSLDASSARPGRTQWFKDPFNEAEMRQWNGENWTSRIKNGKDVTTGRPLSDSQASAVFEYPASWPPNDE